MTETQERKQAIRKFMQDHYTDERLCQLLAHAQEGKLAYYSCCCFIGIVTAEHPLRGEVDLGSNHFTHVGKARELPGGALAEHAFLTLPREESSRQERNEERRRILIPMVRAEIRRREKERAKIVQPCLEQEVAQ